MMVAPSSMLSGLLCLLCLHPPVPISAQLLAALRSGVVPPPLPPALGLPAPLPRTFLPLCGNGRLDSTADYSALFQDDPTNATFQTTTRGPVALFADEACDDGNRLDHDGCSADCMRQDLWSTPCPLRVQGLPPLLEGPIVALTSGVMLVSAKDGLYNVSSLPDPDDTVLRAGLLVRKDFAVSNLFVTSAGGVVAYSARTQTVYSLALDSQQWGLHVLMDLSSRLQPGDIPAYRFPDGDLVLLHDNHTVVLFSLSTATMRGTCAVPSFNLYRVVYGSFVNGNTLTLVDPVAGRVSVSVLSVAPGLQCTVIPGAWSATTGSVWQDAFRSLLYVEGSYAFDGGVSSAPSGAMLASMGGSTFAPLGAAYQTLHLSAGLLSEEELNPVSFPRAWVGSSVGAAASAWAGHPGLIAALRSASPVVCAAAPSAGATSPCFLDAPERTTGGNEEAGLFFRGRGNATVASMADALQGIIYGLPTTFPSFQALYANGASYANVWSRWAERVAPPSPSRLGIAVHPVTGSLWLVDGRTGRLHEVSKSGVSVQFGDDEGTCMPSGLALCPPCMWAVAGGNCTPCSKGPPSPRVWAWRLQCPQPKCPWYKPTKYTPVLPDTLIRFGVLGGRPLALAGPGCAASATWSPEPNNSAGVWVAEILTKEPVQCMRDLALGLAGQPVLRKPVVVTRLLATSGELDVAVLVVVCVCSVVVACCICGLLCRCTSGGSAHGASSSEKAPLIPGSGGSGSVGTEYPQITYPRIVFKPYTPGASKAL